MRGWSKMMKTNVEKVTQLTQTLIRRIRRSTKKRNHIRFCLN
jgi:hypothetical protein